MPQDKIEFPKEKMERLTPDRRTHCVSQGEMLVAKKRYQDGLLSNIIALYALCVPWLMGLVIAAPGLEKVAAYFPPYAYYLVTKQLMHIYGLI